MGLTIENKQKKENLLLRVSPRPHHITAALTPALFLSAALIADGWAEDRPALLPGGSGAEQASTAYARALDSYRSGRFDEAADLLMEALGEDPDGPAGLHSLLGWCRYRLGELETALASFEEALRLAPGDPEALEGVARSAVRLERNGVALDAIATLARLHPHVDVEELAGRVLARTGAVSDRRLLESPRGSTADARPVLASRAKGAYFEIAGREGEWSPLFVTGINLGAALPGRYPSGFPSEKSVYRQWLDQMAEMGANVVRVYTILPPAFYEALHDLNAARSEGRDRLWVVQGVWTELPENHDYDAADFQGQLVAEIERAIDVVHGNIAVAHRPGHAFGLYTRDVSGMTLAYILGREWEPFSVAAYDDSHPGPASYLGDHFRLEAGTPMEAWLARMMDHAVSHEMTRYGAQRPVAFTSWPTLDPLHHPTEASKAEEVALLRKLGIPQEPGTELEYDNDGVSIDAGRIRPTSRTPSGTFANYHVYPYYPDFMNVDPGYLKVSDARGPSNYLGYLRELRAYHGDMPVLIGEFGVPTSRGIAHLQPQGWHHGGHTEIEQGELNARMFENILESGCAGGILFAWMDEWFKKNWLVMDFEVPWDNNKNWLNVLDPEQNYGLLAHKPGSNGWRIVIDGKGEDWADVTPLAGDGSGPLKALRVTHDEAYIYLRLDVGRLDWTETHYVIGIDTYGEREGDHTMPFGLGIRTPTGMEFVVDLRGPASSRVLCDVPYDLHTNRFNRPWRSVENGDGLFVEMMAETNRRRVGRDGTVFPALLYNRSPLRSGTMDPASSRPDDLVEWTDNLEEGFLELRLGWNLLNVTDPSTRQVLDDPVPPRGGAGHRTTEGFRFYVAAYRPADGSVTDTLPRVDRDGAFILEQAPLFTWDPWEDPTYHTYLKKSYFILKERLAAMRPIPVAGVSP